jgi:hypothetical protein
VRDAVAVDAQRATVDLATARQAGEDALTAARRQAERETTAVEAACQALEEATRELAAAAIAQVGRAETALDAERAGRRALTDRPTAVLSCPVPSRPGPGLGTAPPPDCLPHPQPEGPAPKIKPVIPNGPW